MTAGPRHALLIRQAQLLDGSVADVRIEGMHIAAMAASLPTAGGERVVDARRSLLLPGLHDHHCHLFATAAARGSLQCGPPQVGDATALERLLRAGAAGGQALRGVGFHESVCEPLDRDWLDRVCPQVPVRIQHRSGMLWIYNSAALESLHLDSGEPLPEGVERDSCGRISGRFFNLDRWLGERGERQWPGLRSLSREYARLGITGVTDTGVNNGPREWRALAAAIERGEWQQQLQVMGTEALDAMPSGDGLQRGPLKLYLREVDLPPLDAFTERIAGAHRHARAVAIHCVTLVEIHFALEAIASAGALGGDRIEHASVCDEAALQRIADLGITVVSQPHFIAERGDQYLQSVECDDLPLLYRAAAFLRAGVRFAAGSDAPYGDIDPWRAMASALNRTTRNGRVMNAAERLTARQALDLYGGELLAPGGGTRQLKPGDRADLCLLDVPWEIMQQRPDAQHVALTVCAGRVLYDKTDQLGSHG